MTRCVWILAAALACGPAAAAPVKKADIPYVENGHARQVLDIYTPAAPEADARPAPEGGLPIFFWIHGGGWQTGDKSEVALKPEAVTARGFLFVSTNYRLLPEVTMEELVGDVAAALAWVHRHAAKHGGDPRRIVVGGHSAGAQLAALLCTDHRYLARHEVPPTALRGCIPTDGDTYDIPKIIMTAEHRQAIYGGAMPTFGHRQKFGNDPLKHVDFSAVTHVAPGKSIPPFLILYFSGNPDTPAQARRLAAALETAAIPVRAVGKGDTNHSQLNDDLGRPDDPVTVELFRFLAEVSGPPAR